MGDFSTTSRKAPVATIPGGGSLAAFGINGSLYAMFLYLILYFENALHISPLGAGERLAIITGGSLLTSIAAGRLSNRVPVRWLIGPGLLLVGAGFLLMRGLHADSSWTHMILGFAVAGAGSGLVNPPLASTAVGVVAPQDAGMASGINSTFRQIGIATAIAALGTIFASHLSHVTPSTLPFRYATTMNELLLIAALTAIIAGVLALMLIRTKDAGGPSRAGPESRSSQPGSSDWRSPRASRQPSHLRISEVADRERYQGLRQRRQAATERMQSTIDPVRDHGMLATER